MEGRHDARSNLIDLLQSHMEPAELHARLKSLIKAWPDYEGQSARTPDTHEWVARMYALIDVGGYGTDAIRFGLAAEGVGVSGLHKNSVEQMKAIVFRTLARAELAAPLASHGAFIAASSPFQVFAELAKIATRAQRSLLFVDPYIDAAVLTDVASSANEHVELKLLGDATHGQPNLLPAATKWRSQYQFRPVALRMAPARSLHDRLVIVDEGEVWNLSQSIKDFARRSPASIERSQPDIEQMKLASYMDIWGRAQAVL